MDGLSQVGEVVWHTLDDHGIVETYDLRFGDFVVPNVPSRLVEAVHYESHESKGTGHGKKDKLIKEGKSILSISEYLRLIKM